MNGPEIATTFIQLREGRLHFRWHGPKNGPILVLVHGLTTPSFVWRDMMPKLVAAGFRVLTFDHFGRGLSGNSKQPQTFEFFIREIDGLLEGLDIQQPVHMLGYSMGGGIVAKYASNRPDRVAKLVFLAPCGFRTELGGFFDKCARWPIIGDIAMRVFGGGIIRAGVRQSAQTERVDAEMIAMQCQETYRPGFLAAVLSCMRHVTNQPLHKEHAEISAQSIETLAIFAREDAVIPVSGAKHLARANAKAKIVIVPDAGHALAYTHADQVTCEITRFLGSADSHTQEGHAPELDQ